jgi:cytochrome o ubiquinol oxidase operon protein cyoD
MEPDRGNGYGVREANLGSCLTGFFLAVMLTLIAFGLVVQGALAHSIIVFGIVAAAIAQILVHLHYFLHLNAASGARWNLVAIVFSALIICIMAGGTVWIMFNLHYHMTPL